MATNKIVRVSDLSILTNVNGSEELTLSYLTPHKVVVSSEKVEIGTYQYIFNPETKKYDYTYVVSETVEIPKTYRIDNSKYESYKFPLSMINGGNISSVDYDYAAERYTYISDIYGNYAKIDNTYVKIDYDKISEAKLLTYDRYSLKNVDFEYMPNDKGTHVKLGTAYLKYPETYDNVVASYITNAQTFTYEVVLPTEENGLNGYVSYIPYLDKWKTIGNIVEYKTSYYTKAEMLNIINNEILADRYNITGVNTVTVNLDNNTSFSIKAINGSTGLQGEPGWHGENGKKGESAFDYYTTANLSNAATIVTDPANDDYTNKTALTSAQFGYNINNEISVYKEIYTTDEEYAAKNNIMVDTNYYTFEEDGNVKFNKTYNIADFVAKDKETIIEPSEDSKEDSTENSSDTSIEISSNENTNSVGVDI